MPAISPARWLAFLWLLGTALLLARLLRDALRLRGHRHDQAAGPREQAMLHEAARTLRMKVVPRLVVDERAQQPFAFGLRHPAVVLPVDLIQRLDRSALLDLLIHELGHVARRDIAIGWLQRVVGALLWPQPLVHWLRRELDVAREVACDDDVLRSSCAPNRYARTLLTVAERVSATERSALVAPALRRRGDLERRVRLALDGERERPGSIAGFFRVGVAVPLGIVLALGSLFCAEQEKEPRSEPPEAEELETSGATPTDEESRDAESERTTMRRRVLIIEGAPRWEYRYLKNLLMGGLTWESGDGQLEAASLQTWLTSADLGWAQEHSDDTPPLKELPASLGEYQMLILGAVDLEALGREWEEGLTKVLSWVNRGGHLLVLPGREAGLAAYAGTPLAAALPIRTAHPEEGAAPALRWTAIGRRSSLIEAWQAGEEGVRLGELVIVPTGAASEGARVVLEEDADQTPRAVVAKKQHGEGTIAVLGLTDTWRLRHPSAPVRYDTFWSSLLTWLHE